MQVGVNPHDVPDSDTNNSPDGINELFKFVYILPLMVQCREI